MVKKITALILICTFVCTGLLSCAKTGRTEDTPTFLTVGVGKISGDFSPFTRHQGADSYILDTVFTKLWNFDKSGYPECGDESSALSESFRVFYADENFAETDSYQDDGGMTAIEFILKNGILFSNGSEVTAEDVLFSVYCAIDPVVGYLDNASFPLVGRTEYTSQLDNAAMLNEKAFEILSKGLGYAPAEDDAFTAEESKLFWAGAITAGSAFTERIFDYVAETYLTDELAASYIFETYTAADISGSEAVRNAYAMRLWNYGSFVYSYVADADGIYVGTVGEDGAVTYKTTLEKAMEDEVYTEYVRDDEGGDFVYYGGKFIEWDGDEANKTRYSKVLSDKYARISRSGVVGFRDTAGNLYTLEGEDYPTAETFFTLMCQFYTADGVFDYTRMESVESSYDGDSFSAEAVKIFTENSGNTAPVDSVAGIKSDTVTVGETELERVTLYFKGNVFDVIYKTDFYIASRDYYTGGFEMTEDAVSNYGVPLDSEDFAAHLESLKSAPMGAGPYVFSSYSEEEKTVCLTANLNFAVPGGGGVDEMIGDLRFIDVSDRETMADSDVAVCLTAVSENGYPTSSAATYFVPEASYQYALVNPAYYIDINTRGALMSLMDTSTAADGWNTSDLSFSVPSFMWEAESTDSEKAATYDETGETAKNAFAAAGYSYSEEGELIDPATKEKAKFTFTLLPSDKGTKIDDMFIKAANFLIGIGADAEVIYDENLLSNIYSDEGVGIYSLGWVTGPTADLFERYALSCSGDAIKANGIQRLHTGAIIENFGTLQVENESGEMVVMTQSDAVARLDSLISSASFEISLDEKKELYGKALELISELCFELPVYQRGYVCYARTDIVDTSTLYESPTAFKSLISEIWNVRMK